MSFFKFNWREKTLVSWVGLRGAVPIIFATFPLLAGIEYANLIFKVVFFIVLTSVILQGWTITPVAKLLKLTKPEIKNSRIPLLFEQVEGSDTELIDLTVPYNSK